MFLISILQTTNGFATSKLISINERSIKWVDGDNIIDQVNIVDQESGIRFFTPGVRKDFAELE